jgi:hypothetical protein
VDLSGSNKGEYYFDMFVVEKFEGEGGRTVLRFVLIDESKSEWTGERSMDNLFEDKKTEAIYSLKERVKIVKDSLSRSELMSIDLDGSTRVGFITVVRATREGFEVKYEKVTVDWVEGKVVESSGD